ncbi:MAG: phosphoglycerate dehydrogenase [Candidatus Omnitrophota bacterium]|jgi:D-3-phosphoglycerate dehydrogenase|nr:MAG: phosphoglycerate dehydrogenase [Candidatus Omnitrophota bacterium]
MTYRVLVSDPLSQEGIDILQSHSDVYVDVKPKLPPEELLEIIGNYDALVIRSGTKVTRDVLERADRLKVIGRAGVGIDNVDLDVATSRGIMVMNTPGGNTISTAEQTWTLLMSLSRNLVPACISVREGKWDRKKYTGTEIFGKTLGVVGLGRIGSVVGSRALAFGMKVLGYDPFTSEDRIRRMGFEPATLDDIYAKSDYITVHTPINKETSHLLDDQAFAKMKKGVRVINCARGGIIDEGALIRALESGKCAGAALDVYENEPPAADFALLKRDDCICSPHLGASTEEAQTNVAIDIARNVLDALTGGEVRNALNIPSIAPEVRSEIGPYLELAVKMGMFAIQYLGKHADKLEVTYAGPLSKHDTTFLTLSVLKGLLTAVMNETVNYVNAPLLAEKRHIDYAETKNPKTDGYTNLISVKLTSDTETIEICGTTFGEKDPRIVIVDGYHIDAKPYGTILFFKNLDEPGVIGHVGTILAKGNINIADMTLGRKERGGYAVTVCNVDTAVSDVVLDELKSFKAVKDIKTINLR